LGQHFLASAAWRERIARLVLGPAIAPTSAKSCAAVPTASRGDLWVEIGAGHGEMTLLLAAQVGRLIAIELDAKLVPRLQEQTAQLANVTITAGDVLALNLSELTGGEHFRAYGNLPYYITSPIVHHLLAHADQLEEAFLIVQLEVAARMTARPGTRDFGYFSAFTQFYSRPEILLRIPPGAFQPPPKVSSALVALRLPGEREQLGIRDEEGFLRFLKVCFAQKRKTLRNNLRILMPQEQAAKVLQECGIAPSARAEEIGLAGFARIFGATKATKEKTSGAEAPENKR
jgi:16S rRNA (adenine1518-N6/adenine1519-N6)-dimethyltransferase